MRKNSNELNSPAIGLIILIVLIILIILAAKGSPEKEEELREQLKKRKAALEDIVSNIDLARIFQKDLQNDKCRTTIILRWLVFCLIATINSLMFLVLDYELSIKGVLEGIGLVNGGLFVILSAYFFLKYGSFIEVKIAYQQLQDYILKLRYDKTEYEIEAYLNHNLENKETIIKEIAELETQLRQIEVSKAWFSQITYVTESVEEGSLHDR